MVYRLQLPFLSPLFHPFYYTDRLAKMGKPGKSDLPPPFDDAVSLHSQPGDQYLDREAPEIQLHDDDELPPLYDEHAEGSSSSAPLLPADASDFRTAPIAPLDIQSFRNDDTIRYYLEPRLDSDPEFLEKRVHNWAAVPPRPFVRVVGYHRERRDHNGKKEVKNITDFDVQVELTPYLYSNAATRRSWTELRTVENGEKVKRGTIFKARAPGARQSIELGQVEKPNLTQWCHMYCASHSGMKVFSLKRQMLGFDKQRVKEQLDALVRRTNYRGHLTISFPVQDEVVEVWNDSKINQWRLTKWICFMFYATLLFLFTWPYLFFRTKRFEVAVAEWPFSKLDSNGVKKYASISEDQWYNMWGRAIAKAVLSRRQGTLNQQDLIASEGADPNFDTGNSTVDGALGFVRAGVAAMNEVNRHLGWGMDSC